GSLTKQGVGTLILTGDNGYSGGTTVSDGVLQGNTDSLQGNIVNDASVVFDQTGTGPYADVMSGTGSLTKQGVGTLILTGDNNYSGGTNLNGGTLSAALDSSLGALGATPGPLTFNGGILQVTGTSFTSTPRTLNWGAAGGGFDIADASNVFTVGQSLAGTGSLIKQGNGKLVLTGDNDYSGGTTVSDGVLQGNTDSLQGNITNDASVVFDQTSTGTYADVMSGTGSLTKQGDGTLILTGDNSYSGGTTVSDGVLQGNTDSLQGNITNDASVVFDQTSTGTYADVMSGTGSLTKQGDGTLILTGVNNYSGGTNLNGGTLSAGLDSSLGFLVATPGPLTFNGGILQVTGTSFTSTPRTLNWGAVGGGFDIADASNVFTVGQSLAGTGSLTKQGDGTLILTGDNSYRGGTIVSAGVLQGNTDSLQGDITNNATVVFDQANTGTYTGTMSGEGNLIKENTSLLVFNNTNTYTGGTEVIQGNLQVGDASHPGASIFGPVMIDPAGILSGHGTINGDVNNAGIIAPGGSIGTLTVNGNVNFNNSSTFNVEISPQQASLLNVSGLASLGNANVSVLAENGSYNPHSYTILQANSVSGFFNNVNIVNAASIPSLKLLTPSLQFFPNRVDLSLEAVSDPNGPGLTIANRLVKNVQNLIGGRLNTPLGASCPKNSLGFWARGVGMISSADANGDAPRYDGGTAGSIMGVDGQVGEHLSLGIAGFTAHTDATTYQRSNNQSTVDSAGFTLYGAYTLGAWQFKSVIGYDNDTYKAQRNIAVSSLSSRQAQSKTYANHVNNYTEASYSFKSGNLTLQPVVGLQLGWMHRDGFNETGANSVAQNISVNGRTLYTLDTLVGLRTRHELPINNDLKAQFELRTFYDHDFGTLQESVAGQLSDGRLRLLSTSDRPTQRDAGIVGASLSVLTTNKLNFYLDYNGEIWSGQQAHFISGGVRYAW
ncbi:MAG: autotransporter-associated beta strand repeat-containing protein, partial [Methylococcales bacterium]|nr:autotransporter-associated beta strand repeat-containing protein [Methylococcales bacterium]